MASAHCVSPLHRPIALAHGVSPLRQPIASAHFHLPNALAVDGTAQAAGLLPEAPGPHMEAGGLGQVLPEARLALPPAQPTDEGWR